MTTVEFYRCPTHKRNIRHEWVHGGAACGFIRSHHHLGGECRKWDGLTNMVHHLDNGLLCETCGHKLVPFTVTARETETECGDKCRTATGPACECKCRGENHGAN